MSISNPLGLLGLFTIPIIIGLHLLLERKKRVVVSSMFLWGFLEDKFEGEKPKTIPITWLLMLDVMIGLFLTAGLVQPQISLPRLFSTGRDRVILVDTSYSMLAMDGEPDRLSAAKEIAKSIVDEAGRDGDIYVLSVGKTAKLEGSIQSVGKAQLLELIQELEASSLEFDVQGGLSLGEAIIGKDQPVNFYIITDGANKYVDVENFKYPINWVFVGFSADNQGIVDATIESNDNGAVEVFYRIVNYSTQEVNRSINIHNSENLINQEEIQLPPQTSKSFISSFPVNGEYIRFTLQGEDIYSADDDVYLGENIENTVSIGVVTENPYPIDRAVASVGSLNYEVYSPENYSTAYFHDLVIFRGYVPENLPDGTILIFDPPLMNNLYGASGIGKVSEFISSEKSNILNGVKLNSVNWDNIWLPYTESDTDLFEDLARSGTAPILRVQRREEGDVYIFYPELQSGNFVKHPSFPILIENVIKAAERKIIPSSMLVGDTFKVSFDEYNSVQLLAPDSEEILISFEEEIKLKDLGIYQIQYQDKNGQLENNYLGVNAISKNESDISPREWRSKFLNNPGIEDESGQSEKIELGPWLVAIAIILFVVEAWFAWK